MYFPGVVPDCVWMLSVVVAGALLEIVTGAMGRQVGASIKSLG
jgi:hypothetical protein